MKPPSPLESDQSTTTETNEAGIFRAELSDSPPHRRRSSLLRGALVLLLVVGVAVSMIFSWLPSERANWQIAASQAKWLENDLAGAIQILDAAAEEFPDNTGIYEQRIQFCLEAKEFEKALADAERLVSLSPKSQDALGLQSQVLHHLGRHDDAIAVCQEMLRLAQEEWIGSAPIALNSLAYAQALGNTQLDEALEHIDEAMRLAGDNPAMLDTRGFVKYRLDDSIAAREDFERAVGVVESLVAYQESQRLPGVRSYQSESEAASGQQALAVMLYHRALVYDRLGMSDKAKVDRERVRNLGYEPNDQLF